jgi:putative sigma-54 modulation protein
MMQYQIVGKNITVTEGISSVITEKLQRLEKFFVIDDEVTCRALVRSYKVGAKVEITVFTKMMDLRAEVQHDDLYAAVDLAIDKLVNQLRRFKTRVKDHKQPSLAESFLIEAIEDEDKKVTVDQLIRTKSMYLSPMTIEEAITRMEALGHAFFMYLDIEEKQISVLYHRVDGGYGLIQAENKVQ